MSQANSVRNFSMARARGESFFDLVEIGLNCTLTKHNHVAFNAGMVR
jgi:hypothetical protein